MKKKIEISSWPRRSHYEYFQTFDCPMFSITSPVRVDALYRYAKREGVSFFILCLFVLLKALNRVPQLRQRVEEGAGTVAAVFLFILFHCAGGEAFS